MSIPDIDDLRLTPLAILGLIGLIFWTVKYFQASTEEKPQFRALLVTTVGILSAGLVRVVFINNPNAFDVAPCLTYLVAIALTLYGAYLYWKATRPAESSQ